MVNSMNKIKYNIRLNVKTLKSIFEYFNMNEKNTIIKLVTNNKNIIEEAKEYIYDIKDNNVYLKNIKFEKLYYYLSKNLVFNVYYYKGNEEEYEALVYTRMDKVQLIEFNDKYDLDKTKEFLKKYRVINIEYIILFLLLLVGIIIRLVRG